jgi:hypothetical protein
MTCILRRDSSTHYLSYSVNLLMNSLLKSLSFHWIPWDLLGLFLDDNSVLLILNSWYWKHVEFHAFSNTKSKHYFHIHLTFLFQSKWQKRLGIGATYSVGVRYLHPKRLLKERFARTTPKQRISGLLSLKKESKKLNGKNKCCVVFQHDDDKFVSVSV